MKAILVIDEMPTECIECPFHSLYLCCQNETHCSLTAKRNKDGVNTRAEWCPLRPMPHKLQADWYKDGYKKGFNACLDEITGETE